MRKLLGLCVVLFSVCALSVSLFVPVSLSAQPPIDTTTFYEGNTGWGPRRADTVRAYDTASGELLFNCYENLIMWNYEVYWDFVPVLATNVPARVTTTLSVTNTSFVDKSNPKGSTWDGLTCVGWFDFNVTGTNNGVLGAGDVVYLQEVSGAVRAWYVASMVGDLSLNLERYSYTFNVRTSPTINFVNETGQVVDTYDENDVKYSFARGFVQDQAGSPMWMFYEPMLGTMDDSNWDPSGTASGGTVMDLAHLIDSAVTVDAVGHTATFSLGIPFPDNAFKQILSNTWAGIVSMEFSTGIGCWNGDLFTNSTGGTVPDWWYNVRGVSRSPYDGTGANTGYRYCGTGPYRVTVFDAAGFKVIMEKNTIWWQGWVHAATTPPEGNFAWEPLASAPQPPFQFPSNSSLDTIEIDYIADWTTRKTKFLDGEIDTCYVPKANMMELLDPVTRDPPLGVDYKTIKRLSPSLYLDAFHFTFTINATSTFIGTGSFPEGIPTDFFNDTHTRRAFAYSLNQSAVIQQIYFGEAIRQYTPLIAGLYPDYRTVTSGYDANFAHAEAELKQAVFGGQNVWNSGFTVTLVYVGSGSTSRLEYEMMRDFFTELSTYDGRVGNLFTVNLAETDYSTYIQDFENFILPTFDIGWLADFADADNFMRPYMHSNGYVSFGGYLSSFQNYTLTNGWGGTHGSNFPASNKDELIDKAFTTPDGSDRAKMYADLESIYMADCPSLPLPTPMGRRWCKYWVKGWYHNPMYPSTYFATIWKQDNPWYDITGATSGISEGICAMRDISYLIVHFNAKAPVAGKVLDPKWVGDYGANGGVDPYGDRVCNMRDIYGEVLNYNAKGGTGHP